MVLSEVKFWQFLEKRTDLQLTFRCRAWFPSKIAVAFANGHRLAAQRYFAALLSSDAADSEAADGRTFPLI